MKKWLHFFKKNRGQGVVEYGLILILCIIATGAILGTKVTTEKAIQTAVKGQASMNPTRIDTPKLLGAKDVWNHEVDNTDGGGLQLKPVAFFTISNPIYRGETVTYWDNSYDPDGQIVERIWEGKQNSFSAPGTYTIKLTVKDDDDLTDTYEVKVVVKDRENYTKLYYDHAHESRTVLKETPIYETKPAYKRIIDHVYGKRKDLYDKEHIVIEKNYWETIIERAKDYTYEVKVPILEITYDGQGKEISRTQYKVDGVPQYVVQQEMKTVPQPADIKTEWKDNTWTFYVYDSVSSVRNPNNSWGERDASVDHPRFDPEVEQTTQTPDWKSSRTTFKENKKNTGADAPSTPCETCTIPNSFERKSEVQNDYRNLEACGGRNEYLITHNRTHNWIDHKAYDLIYKYTGVAGSQGNAPSGTVEKLLRHSWITEGWQSAEQAGGASVSTNPKYTNCTGSGENCWNALSNSKTYRDSWDLYNSDDYTDTKTVNEKTGTKEVETCTGTGTSKVCTKKTVDVYEDVKYERSCDLNDYRRKVWSCSWLGTDNTNESWQYEYDKDNVENCGSWSKA